VPKLVSSDACPRPTTGRLPVRHRLIGKYFERYLGSVDGVAFRFEPNEVSFRAAQCCLERFSTAKPRSELL
jgi:hypothetical protein